MWYENLNVLSTIGLIFMSILVICFLLFKGKKEESKKIILALIIEAELKFGAGTGSIKYAYVLGFIYPKLPLMVRLFINEDTLDDWIEAGVKLLKIKLQPNATLSPAPVLVEVTNTVQENK